MTRYRPDQARRSTARRSLLGGLLITGLSLTACSGESPELSPGSVELRSNQSPVAVGTATASDATASESAVTAGSATALQTVKGPFGSGTYGHLKISVKDVTLSNIDFDQWGSSGARVSDPQARRLYVTLEVVNQDPNDEVNFPDSGLTLLIGDRPPVAAERVNRQGDFSQSVATQDTSVREFGFAVDGDLSADQLRLRYSVNTVPVTIAVLASAATPVPYPLTVTPPAAFTYNGALQAGCTVNWTVTIDKASVELDLPADLRRTSGGAVTNRAPTGSRWLVLNGVVTAGPAKSAGSCVGGGQGPLSVESFRLVVNGRPFAPVVAPLQSLTSRQSVKTRLVWKVPTGTTAVALRGLGPRGSQAERPFTLPAMQVVPGE